MSIIKNSVSWFEIPVTDFPRAKKFYSDIFNFEMPENCRGETLMGFFQCDFVNGGIGGAIVKDKNYQAGMNGPIVYLNGGDDLQIVLDRVELAGGKILKPKNLVNKDIGYTALFADTEGNRLALHSRN